jgi:acetyl-CoA acetyltransferase
MHLYGTTKEQMGWLAVSSRRHAARNPLAVFREPMTMDDYIAARPVSTPFGLYDCDVPIDGSIAFVVSAAAHASDCPNLPIRIEAMGGSSGPGAWVNRPDYPKMASVDAAADGELPLNTYGGQLSAGRMHGHWVLHEACVQLRGVAGDRQVAIQPEVAVVSNGGGPIAGCMLLTR